MALHVEGGRRDRNRRRCAQHQGQALAHAGVQHGLAQAAAQDRAQQLVRLRKAGIGHHEVRPRGNARHVVVGAAPVRHDGAPVAPLVAQNVLQQVGILVGIGAVHAVVAGHEALWRRLADHNLEAAQVQLAQGALVNHGITGLAASLLRVDGKVLWAGRDARGLDASHVAGSHLAGKHRVLREVLEGTAAKRAALDVEAGAQHHAHALAGRLLGQCAAKVLPQRRIPRVCHGHGGWEAGCRVGLPEAKVVALLLVAHAVRAVGELHARHLRRLVGARAKRRRAAQEGALLPQRHGPQRLLHGCGQLVIRPRAGSRRRPCLLSHARFPSPQDRRSIQKWCPETQVKFWQRVQFRRKENGYSAGVTPAPGRRGKQKAPRRSAVGLTQRTRWERTPARGSYGCCLPTLTRFEV